MVEIQGKYSKAKVKKERLLLVVKNNALVESSKLVEISLILDAPSIPLIIPIVLTIISFATKPQSKVLVAPIVPKPNGINIGDKN